VFCGVVGWPRQKYRLQGEKRRREVSVGEVTASNGFPKTEKPNLKPNYCFYNETTGESNWIDDDPIDNCRDIDIKIPSGWELHTDKETGDRFLYNETTGASNWIDDEISDHVYNNPMDNSRDIEIPSGWELHTDKETADRFLYNKTTGESRWVEDDSATSANNPVFDGANK
jgi:hypothetical protein